VDVDDVADARVERGDDERLTVRDEAQVRDEAGVEDAVDRLAVIAATLGQPADASSLRRSGVCSASSH
jgi:hypothetical protein